MKTCLFLFLILSSISLCAQTQEDLIKEIEAHQGAENEKFSNLETTILGKKDLKAFKGLEFYAVDLKYRVEANFIRTPNEQPFLMKTSTTRLPEYVKYGEVHFEIDGKALQLNVYQSTTPSEDPEYVDYLFLPFTDLTSGDGSYGGGRFLDTYIPESTTMILDFNKAYNPYCAYSPNYSCPIPPKENDLMVRIEAGVKDYVKL
ncbi:DUF1684 domain-containing protein [Rasiella rasia]|uniref:DUF1684 domain-containing protein n=1 Tax=Rasiella rasia TaxID=2744027 RepID=A0A6G6GPU0_9FLAO|nr:DUF1684 domain-containing protein [Rasiella rasia]QIE60557.1 DUF1684 domain-containing protein [Rasiella rasia]